MTTRPDIEDVSSGSELKNWYWLKQELIARCQSEGVPYTGSKQAITERLAHFIDTGKILPGKTRRATSKFDWHSEPLTPGTIITDSYKNTQNVRRFFKAHYGEDFKFNIAFMAWMKSNTGKTLADAVEARRDIARRERTESPPIPAGNQYNRYTRDFFAANPGRSVREARACWAHKRGLPGHNRYEPEDLIALDEQAG